jgi:hypothetical protein
MKENMKKFVFDIHTTCTHWETVEVVVEASTEEEARELFAKDPWEYEWENWESVDSEMHHWEIDDVNEYDGFVNTGEKLDESS